MNKIKERKRAPNFSLREELCLMQLVEQKAATIHCKYMDTVSLENKRKAWEEIDEDFVRKCGTQRGAIKLKRKYECLKSKAKKSLADIKPCCTIIESSSTAANVDSDEIEYKMAALMGEPLSGVTGLEIKVDGDGGSPVQDYPSTSAVPVEVAKNEFDVDLSGCIKVEDIIDMGHNIESAAHSCHAPDAFELGGETRGVFNYDPNVVTTAAEAQRIYYENENRRAKEKHSWKWEKHQWKKENGLLKRQLLRYELEAKEQKLNVEN